MEKSHLSMKKKKVRKRMARRKVLVLLSVLRQDEGGMTAHQLSEESGLTIYEVRHLIRCKKSLRGVVAHDLKTDSYHLKNKTAP